ncbi:hypothetical protein D3C78_976000 [compost metagenome]
MDGHSQLVGKPADHFRVERLAGTADHPQAALDRRAEFAAGSDQQAIGGGRARQVADRVLVDDPTGTFDAERSIEKGSGMAQGQRPGHGVVKPVGPARISKVPEVVFRAQVDGIAHVALKGDDGPQRHFQRLGRAGSAGSEHQQERCVAPQQHRLAMIIGCCQRHVKVDIAGVVGGTNTDDCRAVMDLVELAAIERLGDHHLGPGLFQPVLDSLGAKSGEQRLVDCAQAPGGQHGDQQLDRTRHQAGNPVAGAYTLSPEHIGQARGRLLQLLEAVLGAATLTAFAVQCNTIAADMPVAALDAGVERFKAALQGSRSGMRVVESLRRGTVITHRQTPRFLLLE